MPVVAKKVEERARLESQALKRFTGGCDSVVPVRVGENFVTASAVTAPAKTERLQTDGMRARAAWPAARCWQSEQNEATSAWASPRMTR